MSKVGVWEGKKKIKIKFWASLRPAEKAHMERWVLIMLGAWGHTNKSWGCI